MQSRAPTLSLQHGGYLASNTNSLLSKHFHWKSRMWETHFGVRFLSYHLKSYILCLPLLFSSHLSMQLWLKGHKWYKKQQLDYSIGVPFSYVQPFIYYILWYWHLVGRKRNCWGDRGNWIYSISLILLLNLLYIASTYHPGFVPRTHFSEPTCCARTDRSFGDSITNCRMRVVQLGIYQYWRNCMAWARDRSSHRPLLVSWIDYQSYGSR